MPDLIMDIPSMLLKSDGPLSVDLFYILKNLPWAFKFFLNCRNKKVEEIANSLANILQHARLSYDQIFKEVDVSQYIKNEENIYIYDSTIEGTYNYSNINCNERAVIKVSSIPM